MKKDFQNKTLFLRVFAVFCLFMISQSVHAQISGRVFRDFNSNGFIDGSATSAIDAGDVGVVNVRVTAFNTSGTIAATVLSGIDGRYSLPTSAGSYRLEFSNLPFGDFTSFSGVNNSTSIQFVNDGAQNVNFGVNYPSQFCQTNPQLVTTCYVNGDPIGGGTTGSSEFMVGWQYSPGGVRFRNNYLADGTLIGTTWGIAYKKTSKEIFTSAFLKRHAGFGQGGPSAIYKVDMDGSTAVSHSIYSDLSADLGIDFGIDPRIASNQPLPADKNVANFDSLAFDFVGKMSIGDIDISDDEKTLFVTNLKDRALYAINIGSATVSPPSSFLKFVLPNPGCVNGVYRIFATKYYRGEVYVGGVCTAENGGSSADLKAIVYKINPSLVSNSFIKVLDFPLNYPRGYVSNSSPNNFADAEWNPWMNKLLDIRALNRTTVYGQTIYPQPILSDLEFDVNGDLIMAFSDRLGHQLGNDNNGTDSNDTRTYEVAAGGDLLRASLGTNGNYTLENNATAGSFTTIGANQTLPSGGQGPSGGEYYWADMYPATSNPNSTSTHHEIMNGSVAILSGSGEIVSTVYDPVDQVRSAGVRYYNNKTGGFTSAYEIVDADGGNSTANRVASFGKGANLGDVEILCNVAPIQIGNRIWFDKDKDGIQDAGELTLPNVKVSLYDFTGSKVSEVITNALGEFYFDTLNITGGKLSPQTRYEMRVAKSAIDTKLTLTSSNTGTNDLIDSDAALVGVNYVIPVLTGNFGENNHSYDMGFVPTTPDLKVTKTANKSIVKKGENLKFTITIKNEGKGKATSVKLEDLIPSGATLVNSTTSSTTLTNAGAYNAGIWTLDSLVAKDSVILVVEVRAIQAGVFVNVAQIKSMNEEDDDSTPGNSNYKEDDIAAACYSVPYEYCKADKPSFTLLAPDTLSTVKWFKNGIELMTEAGKKSIVVSDSGSYHYEGLTPTSLCSVGGCCPVILDPYKRAKAGNDSTICSTDGMLQLKAAPAGTAWFTAIGNPSPATIDGATGFISGMVNRGIYNFIIKGDTCCADTIKITKTDCFGSIGDYVWFDANKDGLQTTGEAGVKGLRVYLLNATGVIVDSIKTDINGKYLFDSLLSGSYKVKFVAPKDSNLTAKGTNAPLAMDSNSDVTTGLTDAILIDTNRPIGDPGRDNRDVDAGIIVNLGSIAGKTFNDNDQSGTQNINDTDRPMVLVILYKEINGMYVKVDSMNTDSQGNYKFNNLTTANYQVQFNKPTGTIFTNSNIDNDMLDSDARKTDGKTGVISINANLPETDLGRHSKFNDGGFIAVECKPNSCVPYFVTKSRK